MPTYTYKCFGCEDEIEIKHKMTEKPITECNKCKMVMYKIIRGTSFQLKGKGWFGKSKQQ